MRVPDANNHARGASSCSFIIQNPDEDAVHEDPLKKPQEAHTLMFVILFISVAGSLMIGCLVQFSGCQERPRPPDPLPAGPPDSLPAGPPDSLPAGPPDSLPAKSDRNIFFVDTSCVGELTGSCEMGPGCRVHNREACAVESAARAYSDWNIYLLHTCPLQPRCKCNSGLPAALTYSNVKQVYIDPNKYLLDTPLHSWTAWNCHKKLLRLPMHADLVFSLLTLWKYGGLYLSFDIITLKNLDGFPNVCVFDNDGLLLTNAIHLSSSGIGNDIARELLTAIDCHKFMSVLTCPDPKTLIKIVLHSKYGLNKTCASGRWTCAGFSVYNRAALEPLTPEQMNWLFENSSAVGVDHLDGHGYGLSLREPACYRKLDAGADTDVLPKLMHNYCPLVFNAANTN